MIDYFLSMFILRRCSVNNCSNFSFFNKQVCFQHLDDTESIHREIQDFIGSNDKFVNLNLNGGDLRGINFSKKSFYACSFSHMKLRDVDFSQSLFRLCFFDFSSIVSTNFSHADMQSCVFAGSTIIDCDFSQSDMLHINFIGIHCENSKFNDSDLYFSRFIGSSLDKAGFIDCNLKNVIYCRAEMNDVSFKYSNYEDAKF
ncbi:MAG: pentapeptide repeat-containing protein [Candidatus Heimdallarchaeota archaeon]|nr:pentapeptide repeat-containing protein [Candidatus Heimdallarchaeota archaeon]